MRGGRSFNGLQEQGVLNEYRDAVQKGAASLAFRIYTANPDLREQFTKIAAEYGR